MATRKKTSRGGGGSRTAGERKRPGPPPRLKAERIQAMLAENPAWSGTDRRRAIRRTYRFPSFRASLAFVAFVGELAEALDHHPDIDVRYGKVTLVLTTHEAGGLTDRDFRLARALRGLG